MKRFFQRKSRQKKQASAEIDLYDPPQDYSLELLEPRLLLAADFGFGLDSDTGSQHDDQAVSQFDHVFEESLFESQYGLNSLSLLVSQNTTNSLEFNNDENSLVEGTLAKNHMGIGSDAWEGISPMADQISSRGSSSVNVDADENQNLVMMVVPSQPDIDGVLTFTITGGNDSTLFVIDDTTGELSFIVPPDFENSTDSDSNNIYEVDVTISDDNGDQEIQQISVTVLNVSPNNITVTGPDVAVANEDYTLTLSADEDVVNWVINWGDGEIETVSGAVTSVTHTYTVVGLSYDISVSAVDSDGSWHQSPLLVVGNNGSAILEIDPVTGSSSTLIDSLNGADHLVIGPDGFIYIGSTADNTIKRYDPDTGAVDAGFLVSPTETLDSFVFGPDGHIYASSGFGLSAGVFKYDVSSGAEIEKFTSLLNPGALAFGPNGNLFVASLTGIYEIDGSNGSLLGQFANESDAVEMVFGPDGHLYVAISLDNTIAKYDGTTGAFIEDFVSSGSGGLDGPTGMRFGPDGDLYVSSSNTDEVLRYDGDTGAFLGTYLSSASPNGLIFTPLIQVTVSASNTAPVIDSIADQNINEGQIFNLAVTATDLESVAGDLVYSLDAASLALGMTIDAGTGVISWLPSESQGPGSYSVTVTVSDSASTPLSSSESFTIVVNEINTAPVLNSIGDQTVDEGQTLDLTITASDVDLPANDLTFSLDAASLAMGLTINANTGVLRWTTNESQGGLVHAATVTVTDSGTGNLQDSETFTITVNDLNSAPVLNAIGNQSVDEGSALAFTASASDPDLPTDALTYSLDATSIALGMSIDPSTGAFSWTPTEAQGGSAHTVTITVTDSGTGNLQDSETFTITVNDLNSTPVLNAIGDQAIDEGSVLAFTASASDSDLPADSLVYSLDATSIALGMSINASTGEFEWTSTEAQGGSAHTVTITVTDSGTGNLQDSETFTITVNDLNSSPLLNAIGNQSVDEDSTLTFTATASDSDLPADSLVYSLDATSIALGMSIDPSTGAFSWTPTEGQGGGAHTVTITVTDSGTGNLQDSETFTITVNDLNSAPVLNAIGNQSVDEDSTLTLTATASDSDLPTDTLTYSLDATSIALGMSIDPSTGAFSWTPTEAQGGSAHTVTITVTDSGTGNLQDSETFTITVNDLNDAPVLNAIGNQTADEGSTLAFTASASDSDLPADTLSYSLDATSLALGMSINASTGEFDWTPTEAQGGSAHTVTITVTDSGTGNLQDSETFTITVNDLNDAPVLNVIGDQTVDEDSTLTFTATASDTDLPADTLTYSLDATSIALGMSIDSSTGAFSWTPTEGQGGSAPTVTITVTDSGTGNLQDSETFTITVNDLNSAPVLNAIGDQTVDEDSTLTFTATASDTDLPADTLTYSLDATSIALGMSIDPATGVFSWTPTEAQGGSTHTVTITVTDSGTGNLLDSETFSISVNEIVPVLSSLTGQIVDEGAELSIPITLDSGQNIEGNLSLSLDDDSLALGMTINENTQEIQWSPSEQHGGLESTVTVSLFDSGVLIDTVKFSVIVRELNSAPVITTHDGADAATINIAENQTSVATISAFDADLPAVDLNFSISGGADKDLFSISQSGDLVFTQPPEYNTLLDQNGDGIYEVEIEVDDGIATDRQLLQIVVLESENIPLAAAIVTPPEPEIPFVSENVVSEYKPENESPSKADTDTDSDEELVSAPPISVELPELNLGKGLDESVVKSTVLPPVNFFIIQEDDDRTRGKSPENIFLIPKLNSEFLISSIKEAKQMVWQVLSAQGFRDALDDLSSNNTQDSIRVETTVRSGAIIASGLSVGYIAWLAKGGLMATSLASSLPMWRVLDPIPVLASMGEGEDGDDDQSLAAIIENESMSGRDQEHNIENKQEGQL